MLPQAVPGPKLGFGPFQYDPSARELWKHSSRLRLPSQPREVLEALLERPGERGDPRRSSQPALARGDSRRLRARSRCGGRINCGRRSATPQTSRATSRLSPAEAATGLPLRAVRFSKCAGPRNAGAARELRIEPNRPPPGRWLRLAVAGALVMTAISGGIYWYTLRSQLPAARVVRFSVHPPAGFALEGAASRQSIALSPDGTKLAFTAMDASGAFSLFVRDFESLEPHRVPGTEGAHTMFWSPDGRTLYFTAKGRLWRADREGGAHALLAESPPFLMTGVWLGPERLFLNGASASYTVGASGGDLKEVGSSCWWPQLLPDGKHLLCLMREKPDVTTGPARLRIVRSSDFAVVKDLFPSETRAQFVASTMNPAKGYLLYVRAGVLLARGVRSSHLAGIGRPAAGCRQRLSVCDGRGGLLGVRTRRTRVSELRQPDASGVGGSRRAGDGNNWPGQYKSEGSTLITGRQMGRGRSIRSGKRGSGPLALRCQDERRAPTLARARLSGLRCVVARLEEDGFYVRGQRQTGRTAFARVGRTGRRRAAA